MISSKLASLEARIARLESSLKNKTASIKKASNPLFEYAYDFLEDILKNNFPKRFYHVQNTREGFDIIGENGEAIIEIAPHGEVLSVEVTNNSTGRSDTKTFDIPFVDDGDEGEMMGMAEDICFFIEREMN
jgi:hypothetical protein